MSGRVLLTGASGFLGRQAIRPLLQRGYQVHAVARREASESSDGVHWHRADLLRADAARALIDAIRPTHLLHFAWYVEHGEFWHSPENLRWVGASLELLRAFAGGGGRRAVLAGSCAEYEWGHGRCSEAETPLLPATLYGACKHALHVAAAAYARQAGFGLAWGRLFLLYGPHEAPRRLVPSVVRALLAGEEARCSHGEQVRDFLHVADAADAFAALLDSGVAGAVNVASGVPARIRDVVRAIGERTGRPERIRLGALPPAPGDPAELTADVARLRDEVGWRPSFDLAAGVDDVVRWWSARLAEGRPAGEPAAAAAPAPRGGPR